jgi:hypothetical protein
VLLPSAAVHSTRALVRIGKLMTLNRDRKPPTDRETRSIVRAAAGSLVSATLLSLPSGAHASLLSPVQSE